MPLSQFEHVAGALEPPVRRRQRRICQQIFYNARTCRRQAQETATPAGPPSAITALAATIVDSKVLKYDDKYVKQQHDLRKTFITLLIMTIRGCPPPHY